MSRSRLTPSGRSWRVAVVGLVLLLMQSACETAGRSPADTRLEILVPPTYTPTAMGISPDSEQIVYVSEAQGRPQLWVYSLESEDGRPLEGTEQPYAPFWSPDSRFIGFFADGLLKTIDVSSGVIEILRKYPRGTAGSWNADGMILFTGVSSHIGTVPATGGPFPGRGGEKPMALLKRPGQRGLRAPYFLQDGRHFLYLVAGVDAGLYLAALEEWEIETLRVGPGRLGPEQRASLVARLPNTLNPEQRASAVARIRNTSDTLPTRKVERLVDSESGGVYHPSGNLLYVRGGTLYAHGFDLDDMSLTGEEFAVTDEGISWVIGGNAALSVSNAGDLVYRARTDGVGVYQLTWVDRKGNELERLGGPQDYPANPEISPDGDRVAFQRLTRWEGLDIYTLDGDGGEPVPLASRPGHDQAPAWSPDGERIAFTGGGLGIGPVWTAADGSGTPVPMPGGEQREDLGLVPRRPLSGYAALLPR